MTAKINGVSEPVTTVHVTGYPLAQMVVDYGGPSGVVPVDELEDITVSSAIADLPDLLAYRRDDEDFDWPADLIEWVESQQWYGDSDIDWPGAWSAGLSMMKDSEMTEIVVVLYWTEGC